jgi:hypothetical protein
MSVDGHLHLTGLTDRAGFHRNRFMMRLSLIWALLVAGLSYGALAQNNNNNEYRLSPDGQFHVKKLPSEKAHKTVSTVPLAGSHNGSASSANAKDLNTLEHQSAKGEGSHTASRKSGSAFKPVKDKPNTPINFNGSGGAKGPGMTNQGPNPYKGRLRQRHVRSQ